jgi:hypothetical protein
MSKALLNSELFKIYLDSEKVWEIIETGGDIDILYPESFKTEKIIIKYEKEVAAYMEEGEKFVLLEDYDYDYALTTHGRVYACKFQRFIKPSYIRGDDVKIIIRNTNISMKELYKKIGWTYDFNFIQSRMLKR